MVLSFSYTFTYKIINQFLFYIGKMNPVFHEVCIHCHNERFSFENAIKRIERGMPFYEYIFSKYPDKGSGMNFRNLEDINKWLVEQDYDPLTIPFMKCESLKEKATRYEVYFHKNHKGENLVEWISEIQNRLLRERECSHLEKIKERISEQDIVIWEAILYDHTMLEIPWVNRRMIEYDELPLCGCLP
jgi:hypothetical protein